MADIGFYHLTSTNLFKALPKLLEKIISNNYRVLVKCLDYEFLTVLDTNIWTVTRNFVPHAKFDDPYPEMQPILLVNSLADNLNNANILVVLQGEIIESGLDKFQRIIDIFDGNNEEEVIQARKRYKFYSSQNHNLTYFKQNLDGSWEQK